MQWHSVPGGAWWRRLSQLAKTTEWHLWWCSRQSYPANVALVQTMPDLTILRTRVSSHLAGIHRHNHDNIATWQQIWREWMSHETAHVLSVSEFVLSPTIKPFGYRQHRQDKPDKPYNMLGTRIQCFIFDAHHLRSENRQNDETPNKSSKTNISHSSKYP